MMTLPSGLMCRKLRFLVIVNKVAAGMVTAFCMRRKASSSRLLGFRRCLYQTSLSKTSARDISMTGDAVRRVPVLTSRKPSAAVAVYA